MENVRFDEERDEIHVQLGVENSQEIIINNELHLHVYYSADGGYIIDQYKYSRFEEPSEDDFIQSGSVWFDDMRTDIQITTVSTDGTDEQITDDDSYYLIGANLYYNDEVLVSGVDQDTLVQAILDNEHDRVVKIEVEDNLLYEEQ